ncbi:hypothetical protein CES85_5850 (plasmid) [Ochrobactrum quorumnocens]|uniref:Uncharacterized protein n=1 Tax=Ochrobactrum quorumnocens TaxID=271865 RepID=A0A248U8C3_9HYPH|nr:DUF6511 domain-containing protein [[Ochrobactrum] quorumnocens]ASV83023.1 hypothetical protein CES85_5850 [[Ochrobactrum] quorumnocens]
MRLSKSKSKDSSTVTINALLKLLRCADQQQHAYHCRDGRYLGWLCKECADIAEHIRSRRRLDPYELRALDTGVEAVGAFLGSIGKTDLADCDELEARMLVKAAWGGCGRGMREALKDAPF